MGSALLMLLVIGMTPEEEVEAWQPKFVERDADEVAEGRRVATSILAPLVAFGGGIGAGAFTLGQMGNAGASGEATWATTALVGVATFDVLLGLGLVLFLPPGLPGWTVPVAIAAATVAAAGGVALTVGMALVYIPIAYRGSDCICGADLLVFPLLGLVLPLVGAAAATVLTTTAAASDE